jgi:membrane protease YdiL (CAAX protease family)
VRKRVLLKSPVRKIRTPGSVRGLLGNWQSYRNGARIVSTIMDDKSKQANNKNWLLWAGLYAVSVLALGSYLNYTEPYSPGPVTTPILWQLILWVSLYLPVIVLPLAACWKVTDFGFSLNPKLAIAALLITLLCAVITNAIAATWGNGILEAFARTGEEVFFRGFLITFFIRLFDNKRRPWLWAAIASSILFALVHTQTFQQLYPGTQGSSYTQAIFTIIQRLLNIFIIGFVFSLLRVWTRSIVPGAIAHGIINSNILALPFVLVIYGLITFWAYRRGEQVAFRFGAQES